MLQTCILLNGPSMGLAPAARVTGRFHPSLPGTPLWAKFLAGRFKGAGRRIVDRWKRQIREALTERNKGALSAHPMDRCSSASRQMAHYVMHPAREDKLLKGEGAHTGTVACRERWPVGR
jgi:hypothetical protein